MNTLNLFFTGLCAFVPNRDRREMRVVMVDATHGGHGMVPHIPALVALEDSARLSPRPPTKSFTDGTGVNRLVRFDLHGLDLSIAGADPDGLNFEYGAATGCPATAEELRSFRRVASLSRINDGNGRLLAGGLAQSKVPHAVVARFRLTRGDLKTHTMAQDSNRLIVNWRFRDFTGQSTASVEQAIAEEVVLSHTFGTTSLEILVRGGIHGADVTTGLPILLQPIDNMLPVWVMNMPEADIEGRDFGSADLRAALGLSRASERAEGRLDAEAEAAARADVPPGRRDPDYHFEHFYDLVEEGPRNRIPHPFGRCPRIPGPGVSNPKCPIIQLDADASA